MDELNAVIDMETSSEAGFIGAEERMIRDYDEEPYSNDNILVRASKRRSFFNLRSDY